MLLKQPYSNEVIPLAYKSGIFRARCRLQAI